MSHTVVVELDRQLGTLDTEDVEELLLVFIGLDGRQRLRHPPEHDPPAVVPLEPYRDKSHPGLEPDLLELQRPAEDEGRAERRVSGEGHLDRRREDPDARVALALRLVDEDRLGEVHLPGDLLELLLRDLTRVGEDGDLVALQRRVREDVGDDVAEASHAAILAISCASTSSDMPRPLPASPTSCARSRQKAASRHGRSASGCATRTQRPAVVLTSPLLRARETGGELARALDVESEPDERLAPGASVDDVRAAVEGRGDQVVVVGHQPDCGQIAAALTGGPEPRFPAGGLAVLELD